MAKKRKLDSLDKNHNTDIQIAAGMLAMALITPQGIQSLMQVLKGATDPASALAHAIFLAMGKVRQALMSKHIDIDPRVWIAGGGVLDRVLFEIMMALVTIGKYQPAGTSDFVHQVKSDVLDLMEDDDQNTKSISMLHNKGLPVPGQQDPSAGPQRPDQQQPQQPQGLAAPQQGAPANG